MRNFNATLCFVGCVALASADAALALDPAASSPGFTAESSPSEALRAGARAYYSGNKQEAIDALSFAADKGIPAAQWKLGRMYADGDGVAEDDLKAFEYFSRIANQHGDDAPGSSQAPFIASAFVAIGSYYLTGIQDSAIKPNMRRARDIFTYAASYFGSADAQFNLGQLYLDGHGGDPDPRMAARWLKLAAQKGHYRAQAVLGNMLFFGDNIAKSRIRGLMWLTVALPHADAAGDAWIRELQERAFSLASEAERRRAMQLAQRWENKAVASR